MTKRLWLSLAVVGAIIVLGWVFLRIGANWPAGTLIGSQELVRLITPKGEVEVVAKIDTGSAYSSIDESLARSVGLQPDAKKVTIITGEGRQERFTTKLTFMLDSRRINAEATLADRSNLSTPMLIGRDDLGGFLVDPEREFITEPKRDSGLFNLFFPGDGMFSGDQGVGKLMIIIPIMGSVIVLVRLLAGIRTYGIFAPVVIALSLLDLNIGQGLLIYGLLIVVGMAVKLFVLKRLELPNIAELSLIMFVLVLLLLGISLLPIGFSFSFADVFFRLVITSFIIEQASRTAEEYEVAQVIPLLVATFGVAVLLAFYGVFLSQQSFMVLWAVFAASVLATVLAGNYLGLRLNELIRFKFLRRTHVHK
ncbi:MAG: ATP-dependent zinc protease [Chloroflexi bacterium]|nr:ATP-dependent zinc protease [Chloroflexota bacterium]